MFVIAARYVLSFFISISFFLDQTFLLSAANVKQEITV